MSRRLVGLAIIQSVIVAGCSTPFAVENKKDRPDLEAAKKQFGAIAPNGKLTFDEATEFHAKLFKASDKDGDSYLSPAEFPDLLVIPPETKLRAFEKFDRNGDRHLTEKEFQVHTNMIFQRDRNGDGTLTLAERLSPAQQRRRPPMGKGKPGGKPGGQPGGMPPGGRPR